MRCASRQRSQDRLRGVVPRGSFLEVCLKFLEDVLLSAGDDALRVDGEVGADLRHFVAELALLEDDDERKHQSASPAPGPPHCQDGVVEEHRPPGVASREDSLSVPAPHRETRSIYHRH